MFTPVLSEKTDLENLTGQEHTVYHQRRTRQFTPHQIRTVFIYTLFSALNKVLKMQIRRCGFCLLHSRVRGPQSSGKRTNVLQTQMKEETQRAQKQKMGERTQK